MKKPRFAPWFIIFLETEDYPFKILIMIARIKKIIAIQSVRIEITFSAPLSLVLTKTLSPPPVIAPEAPSDLPP